MSKGDRFYLRLWIAIVTFSAILKELVYLAKRSETAPFSSHPYLVVSDVLLAAILTGFLIWGANKFWRLLNEKSKDSSNTAG